MALYGADVESLRQLAQTFNNKSQVLDNDVNLALKALFLLRIGKVATAISSRMTGIVFWPRNCAMRRRPWRKLAGI